MRYMIPLALLALTGCGQASADAGGSETARFAAAGFQGVALIGPDDVRVVPGAQFAVVATGPKAVLDKLNIHVDQGVLKVDRKRTSGWMSGWKKTEGRAQITVTMPRIRSALLSGAGALDVLAPTVPDRFTASLSGAGDLTVGAAVAQTVEVRLTGSGDVALKGKGQALAVALSGSGNLDADQLPVQTADLRLSGVGNIRARVRGSVQGSLSGVGDIAVRGGATCALKKSGVGDVHCAP